MPSPPIYFHNEHISFTLRNKTMLRKWIQETILEEKALLNQVNYIFCDDAYLHQLNKEYLQHNTLTDIITFDYSEKAAPEKGKTKGKLQISGDIYISIERVRENAKKYVTNFENELHRVMIHGVLHLLGYKDKTDREKRQMRSKEEYCLQFLPMK